MRYQLIVESDDPQEIVLLMAQGAAIDFASINAKLTPNVPVPQIQHSTANVGGSVVTTEMGRTPPAVDDEQPNTNAPTHDARGYPWDARIHAATKATNKDGTWRYRRGTEESVIKTVEEELRVGGRVVGSVVATVAAPPTMAVVVEQPAPAVTNVIVEPAQPAPAPVADDPLAIPAFLQRTAAPAVETVPVLDFAFVVNFLAQKIKEGKMTQEQMPQFYANLGMTGAMEMQTNPATLQKVYDAASVL